MKGRGKIHRFTPTNVGSAEVQILAARRAYVSLSLWGIRARRLTDICRT